MKLLGLVSVAILLGHLTEKSVLFGIELIALLSCE